LQPSESKQLVVQEMILEHTMSKKLNGDDSFFGHQNKIVLANAIHFGDLYIGEIKVRRATSVYQS
jgi:hypothetical protein